MDNKSSKMEDSESPFLTKEFYIKENSHKLSACASMPQVNTPFQQPAKPSPASMLKPEHEESELSNDAKSQEMQLDVEKAEWFEESEIEELEGNPTSWLGPSINEPEANATSEWSPTLPQAGENGVREAMEDGLFTSELFEAIPENLERLAPREYALVANGKEAIELQERVVRHLMTYDRLYPQEDKEKTKSLRSRFLKYKCVGTSLFHFSEVCKSLGITADTVSVGKGDDLIRHNIPRILRRRRDGVELPFSWKVFLRLWYSNIAASKWGKLDNRCKGGGAAGALLYAGLVENDICITSRKGEGCWPSELRHGAFLQLWQDEQTYEAVKNADNVTLDNKVKRGALGHSCIFRSVDDSRSRLIVADQLGQKSVWRWGVSFRYLIGANLKRVKVASRLD